MDSTLAWLGKSGGLLSSQYCNSWMCIASILCPSSPMCFLCSFFFGIRILWQCYCCVSVAFPWSLVVCFVVISSQSLDHCAWSLFLLRLSFCTLLLWPKEMQKPGQEFSFDLIWCAISGNPWRADQRTAMFIWIRSLSTSCKEMFFFYAVGIHSLFV